MDTVPDSAGRDGRPAPGLRDNVRERFRERPLVPRGVLGVVLAFAIWHVGRLREDARAVFPGRSQWAMTAEGGLFAHPIRRG